MYRDDSKKDGARTGDETGIAKWIVVFIAAAACLTTLIIIRIRKKVSSDGR